MDMRGSSDPYVMVTIQPGGAHSQLKTKVVKRNLNPVFNETFLTMVRVVRVMVHVFIIYQFC